MKTIKVLGLMLVVVMLFTVNVAAAATGASVTIEQVEVEVGTSTVEVDIDVVPNGTGSILDYLTMKLDVDAGLTLKSVVLPTEYQATSEFTNNSNVNENLIYVQTTFTGNGVEMLPLSKFVCTFEIADPTLEKTYNIGLVNDSSTDMSVDSTWESYPVTLAQAGYVTVKSNEPPAEVNWATGTDAGFYTVDEDVFGLMRFLFDVSTEGVVTETGIKYLKAEDITATITGAEVSGTATTFYGDVVAIPEGTAGTYYAAAYAVVDGETRWSAPVACTPDFVKAVIK